MRGSVTSLLNMFLLSCNVSGEVVLQDWKSDQDLAAAQQAKELSPLGVEIFSKIIKSSGDLGDKVGLALYMEGIIRLSKLRPGQLKRGEKALPSYLPRTVKQKVREYQEVLSPNSQPRY